MGREVAVVSYRLGGDDGVSVEARKWAWALGELGFHVRRVAGRIEDSGQPDDVVIPSLGIEGTEPPDAGALARALEADVVIVENLCSLPLNIEAARVTAKVVEDAAGRVVFRHHDLPWQRRNHKHLGAEFPPKLDGALHTTINLRSRRELQARGYDAHTVHNYFDLDPSAGDRDAARTALGFAGDDLVVFQPARAIERKNVPGGIRFAGRLAQLLADRPVRYWLSGPAEDGYAPTLEKVLDRASVPVTLGRAPSAPDAYAAADVVVYPSTWEGFGNPTIESIAARRPCAAFRYPVLAEILATGVQLFATDQPEAVAKFLIDSPEAQQLYFDVNLRRARLSFSLDELPAAIDEVLAA